MNIKNALTPRWIFRINYDFLTRLKRFKIEHKWGCCPKKLYNSDPKRTARLQIDSFNFEFKPVFMQRRYLLHLNRDIYKWTKICILYIILYKWQTIFSLHNALVVCACHRFLWNSYFFRFRLFKLGFFIQCIYTVFIKDFMWVWFFE